MMAETGEVGRWLVVASLSSDESVVLPPRIDFANCHIIDGELHTRVRATSSDEAKKKAEVLFRRATRSLILASRKPHRYTVNYVRSLGGSPSSTTYLIGSLEHRLTPEDTTAALELYGTLRRIRPAPRRLEMALTDLEQAVADGTPFAFVHLHRCLEQIKEYFGDWPAVHTNLSVSQRYLMYISTRRHSPEFGTAHAPRKGGPRTTITPEEIREGISMGVEVVKRFIFFLAGKPVGDSL